ncbi:TetR/AcrR family transcriptional regulator [Chloroflexus sp.]|uniref:TetR/AcrR family transcriptional regulator n=1 Tax=Chloroflexus sp. TaxID=1904827 RepID=UPI0029FC6CD9|nr:TetR/AcrR family transcriptional regulator [Chloroflexus sp.]MCS6886797.1 TetR/AcrR family transcriptional regulator [Chloroflexus sp.]
MEQSEATLSSAERILAAATALFASYGYHGMSMRALATATGLNVATIHYHFGNKLDLYRAVFRRLAEREQALITAYIGDIPAPVIADPPALQQRLNGLIDALVELTLTHPELPRLWLRRWLEQDDSPAAIEGEVSLPLYAMVLDLLQRAQAANAIRPAIPDLRLILHSFTWILYGYFAGGPLDPAGTRLDPTDPARVAAFKHFLHLYAARLLGLPDPPVAGNRINGA